MSRSVVGCAVLLGVGTSGACILADPPADLPVTPLVPPEIVRVDVQPPITAFLDTFPNFTVPVSVDSRERSLEWQFFIDQVQARDTRSVENVDGGTLLVLNIDNITAPILTECHTFELFVFYPDQTSVPSDTVAWFYSPTHSFDGCPVFDGGAPDGGAEDAASDGGD